MATSSPDPKNSLPSNDYFDKVLRPPEEPPVIENDINDFIKANNLTDSTPVKIFTNVCFGLFILMLACIMVGVSIAAIRWGLGWA